MCILPPIGGSVAAGGPGSETCYHAVTQSIARSQIRLPAGPGAADAADDPLALRVSRGLGPLYDNPYGLMAIMGTNVQLHLRAGLLLMAAYAVVLVLGAVAPGVPLFLGVRDGTWAGPNPGICAVSVALAGQVAVERLLRRTKRPAQSGKRQSTPRPTRQTVGISDGNACSCMVLEGARLWTGGRDGLLAVVVVGNGIGRAIYTA